MMQIPTPTRGRFEAPHYELRRLSRRRLLAAVVIACLTAGITTWLAFTHRSRTPTAGPATGTASAEKLQWAPPPLSHPRTIKLSTKNRELVLDPKRDFRLVMPDHPITVAGGLSITGGHNVVMIGGTLLVPSIRQAPDPEERRGIYLKGQTGVIHIEGLKLGGDLSEGLDLDERLGATVQIENVQVATVHGSRNANHADVIQTWAGPAQLRIDRLQAASDYQGLFLLPNQHWSDGPPPRSFDIKRSIVTLSSGAGYGVWVPDQAPWLHADGLTIITDKSNRAQVLWPPSQLGDVTLSKARAATTLPYASPGVGYHSPGYRSKASP